MRTQEPKPAMPTTLTIDNARISLNAHVAAKGAEIFQKYGPEIRFDELQRILADPDCVRYPCELAFSTAHLNTGEFAYPVARGATPEDGFTMAVHPSYMTQLGRVPYLVFYQLVSVNYGEFASPDDAVTFGAHALGLKEEDYYEAVCELANQLPDCQMEPPSDCHCPSPKSLPH
jgi:hypothetical protein